MKIPTLFIVIPFVSFNAHAVIDIEINKCVESESTKLCCMIKGRVEDLFYEIFEAGIVKKEMYELEEKR